MEAIYWASQQATGGLPIAVQLYMQDLKKAQETSNKDPHAGLELLAHVVLVSVDACTAGDAACIAAVRAAVAALLGFLQQLIRVPDSNRPPEHLMTQIINDTAMWSAVQTAMQAVYSVDDAPLATTVLRGWRRCASMLLQPCHGLLHLPEVGTGLLPSPGFDPGMGSADRGGDGAESRRGNPEEANLEISTELDDDPSSLLPWPHDRAITTDPRVIEELLDRCVTHARSQRRLGGLPARVVALLHDFQTCCGVNTFHDGDPLLLLLLWVNLLLHPTPQPSTPLGGRNGLQYSRASQSAGGGGAERVEEQFLERENRALASVCGALYPLASPAMQRWVAKQQQLMQHHREKRQLRQGQGQQQPPDEVREEEVRQEQPEDLQGGDDAPEPLSPPVIFFQVLLAVVQDGAAHDDVSRWSPYIAAALEQTAQQLFGLLGGDPDMYSACWSSYMAGAEESLAAATVRGEAAAAVAWAAEPGVVRVLDLLRSYSGLPLIVRAMLARCSDNRKKVAAIMALLTAMCRPGHEATTGATARQRRRGGDGDGSGVCCNGSSSSRYSGPHPMSRLVELGCELLLPESNCPVDVRVAALHMLWSALDEHLAFLDEQEKRREHREHQERRRRLLPAGKGRKADGGEPTTVGASDAAGGGSTAAAAAAAAPSGDEGQDTGDGDEGDGDEGDEGDEGDGSSGDGGSGGDEEGGGSGQQAASLWSRGSVDALFFSLLHDPSIKVRRAGMRLVSLVVMPAGGDGATRLARTLLAKLRDKDTQVSDRALELLVQLPPALIHLAMTAMTEPCGTGAAAASSSSASSSWAVIVHHCVSGLVAAVTTAPVDASGGCGDGDHVTKEPKEARVRVTLTDRVRNYRKLLAAVLEAATTAATATMKCPHLAQRGDSPCGASTVPHPLELLLLPVLLCDLSAIGTAVAMMQRVEVVAERAIEEEAKILNSYA